MNEKSTSQYERMTQSSIAPLVLSLAVPSTLTMLVSSIYNLADTAFVGQLGTSASGAVGVVFGFMAIIQALGFVFGQGAGSNVSRALGRQDQDAADTFASTGFFLALGSGALLSLLSLIFLDQLIVLLGSTPTIAPYAKTYISFILFAAPFMTASFAMNQTLRFEGKAALAMVGITSGAILNIFGDFFLIFGLNMGIAGAGLSTAISEIVSFSILLSMFLRRKSSLRLSIKLVCLEASFITNIIRTGFPSMLRQGLTAITTMMLNASAAVYGDAAVAAMAIVTRITFFVYSIALGVGQGFQPVCGFNYGARKYARVRKAYFTTVIICEIFLVVAVVFLMIFSGELIRLFRDDPDVITIGTRALRIQGLSLLAIPPTMVTEMMCQSTGQTRGASLISSLRGGLLFIPALLILSNLRGLYGIEEAQAVAYVLAIPPAVWIAYRFLTKMPDEDEA